MSRKWTSVALILALTVSTSAVAQTDQSVAGSAGATSGSTATDAGQSGATDQSVAGEPMIPNAPLQATSDGGPLPAGNEAGTTAASSWSPGTTTIAAVGVAAVGAAVCLAVCGGSGRNTTTTTTTTPK